MKDRKPATPEQMYFAAYDGTREVYTGRQVIAPDEEPAPREVSKLQRLAASPVMPNGLLSRRLEPKSIPVSQTPDTQDTAEDTQ